MILLTAKRLRLPWIVLVSCAYLVAACAESEEEETHGEPTTDCQAIADVCTHDVTGDLAEECHEIYHGNDVTECTARKEECVDFCTSALGDGGGSGASH